MDEATGRIKKGCFGENVCANIHEERKRIPEIVRVKRSYKKIKRKECDMVYIGETRKKNKDILKQFNNDVGLKMRRNAGINIVTKRSWIILDRFLFCSVALFLVCSHESTLFCCSSALVLRLYLVNSLVTLFCACVGLSSTVLCALPRDAFLSGPY